MGMTRQRKTYPAHTIHRRHRGLRLEPLESRTLLSATPTDNSFRLAIYADSTPIEIPAEVGVQADDSTESLFSIDDSGQIYLDTSNGQNLGDFFHIWQNHAGLAGNRADAVLTEDQLLGNIEENAHTVQMFVNGQVSTEFDNYVVQNGDEIVLIYGHNPVLSLNTNYGPIVIELFEDATPITVNNFLNYVNDGDYLNAFFHRSVENFVIQGGGYKTDSTRFTDAGPFTDVPADAPIQNEPGISNLRGTFAMAKRGGDPDSATSQFFVNLTDDHATSGGSLDTQNGGFTVFGQVLDMTTVDAIAALPIAHSNDSPFNELPLGPNDELVVIQTVAGQGALNGVKYYDENANGMYDNGDSPIAGVKIYVDLNNNGVHDAGEAWTESREDGSYRLQLPAGEYDVRSEVTAGNIVTYPPIDRTYRISVLIGREHFNLDFGERALSDPVHSDLGTVDFVMEHENDLATTRTYSFQTAHDGILTVEGLYATPPESIKLTLHDDQGNELAGSQIVDGSHRIDWETTAGVAYTVHVTDISGSFALRIANLIHKDGTTVTVHGTAEADDFLFSAEDSRNVTINGVRYAYANDEVSLVNFDADTGSDVVRVEGSPLAETLTATFEGTEAVPTMVFATNAGATQPFTVTATNYEQLLAWSRTGAADSALLEDSPGRDKGKMCADEDVAMARGMQGYQEFYRRTKLFEEVRLVGSNNPAEDSIVFYDTSKSDHFEANPQTAEYRLTTDNQRTYEAAGFTQMLARSNYKGDADTATFVDSSENDKFAARPGKASLYCLIEGNQFQVTAREFEEVNVDFLNGGYDKARLTDSLYSDHFVGKPTLSTYNGPGFSFNVQHAEEVSVSSLHDNASDTAELYDTAIDDLLRCGHDDENQSTAQLWTPDELGRMLYQLIGFDTIDAYGTTGTNTAEVEGVDFVQLHGSWEASG